ncbi:MAG: 60S ribosomal subunit assembly/export protein [Icmadophila ericetorum]|nr:60S ribosomal subunit assembly/export protein [Icmadophila ericetorum]
MAPSSGKSSRLMGGKGGKLSKKGFAAGTTRDTTKVRSRVSKNPKAPPPTQQKTKSTTVVKKKRRTYTDKQLGLPTLNKITPVGVEKPKGKKKGKVFIDDAESMMTILAIVNAEREGQIESKLMKSRQMEDIREAKRKEAEARQDERKSKLEETKDSIRRKRKRDGGDVEDHASTEDFKGFKPKKRVSFG